MIDDEPVKDVGLAWGAAHLTQKLIEDVKVRRDRRQQFSIRIGDTAVEQATKVVEGEKDAVTGLLLNTVMRRNVAQRLQRGEDGTMVGLDMVGLKHLNAFSHEIGDNGLKTVAKVLQEFGFAELGRKGDEFYGFVPGMKMEEFKIKFQDFIRVKQADNQLREKETGIQLLSYWDCGYISDIKDLDGLVSRLDERTERVKAEVARKVLDMINTQPTEQKADLMMLYFNLKVRAQSIEIAKFIRSLDAIFRKEHGITADRESIDENVLERIPAERKKTFHEFQELALRELKLN